MLVLRDSKTYQLSEEIVVRELDGKKLGLLTATTSQPKAIQLGKMHSQSMQPSSTMLTINLEFHPASHDQSPPRPKRVHSKLNAMTYFGIEPYEDLPDRIRQEYLHPRHRSFCRGVSLQSRDIKSVHWEKQSSGVDVALFGEKGRPIHKATISLPIILPESVVYTPTFFSCLLSRTYSLRVDVSFNFRHKMPFHTSTVSLTVPIQICSELAERSTLTSE